MPIAKERMRDILISSYDKYHKDVDLTSSFFGCIFNHRKILKQINAENNIDLKSYELEAIFRDGVEETLKQLFCYCGNRKDIKSKNCCRKCASNSEEFSSKVKQTKIDRYGDEKYNNKDKQKQTVHNRSNEDQQAIQEKIKQTCLEKYGVDNARKAKEIIKKIAETKEEKYGDKNYNNIKQAEKTKQERYNNAFFNNREKAAETCLEKYGVDNAFKSEEIKQKIRDINIERYGSDNVYKRHILNIEHLNELYTKEHFIKDGQFLIDEFCDYFNLSHCHYYSNLKELFNIDVPVKGVKARTQKQIHRWLSDLLGENKVSYNIRSILGLNNELDLYVSEHKIAIEYDGLMYHSFGKNSWSALNNFDMESKLKQNHLKKTDECKNLGISLLHIFENEWLEKQDIWKSVIKSKLGLNERVYARKCKIVEMNKNVANQFLNDNHLQGSCNFSIGYGLVYNSELISVMTFGKSRFNKNYQYELIRFCNKQNLNVVGGASKLLKQFIKSHNPETIISYANRRWSEGNLYKCIGFEELNKTDPNYFYFNKDIKLKNRMMFQKHKLKDVLQNFDDNLSETENMYNNGYRKIYDCGNIVFGLNLRKVDKSE